MPVFGLVGFLIFHHISIPFSPPACSRAADALRTPQQFPPTLSGPDPTFAEIRCFCREMEAKTFFSGFL